MNAEMTPRQATNVKTVIAKEGQPYIDEPVYVEISKAKPLALAINRALMRQKAATRGPHIAPEIKDLSHYNRVQLRWLRPDGKGGLVPR